MAIAYRSEAHTSYGSTPTSVTCSKPTGTVDDGIMVATLFQGRYSPVANAPTPPSGWAQISTYTIVNDVSSFYARCSVWWKRAASEGSSYTWTMGADSPSTQVVIASYSGCIASGDPVDVASANSSTVTGTVTATSVTTTVANTKLLFTGHNWDGDGTLTPPTGMTERFDGLVYLADQDIASAGATGNRTLTLTGQPFWGIFLIALKPATGTNVTASPTGNALTVSIGTVSVTAAGSASATPPATP